MGADEGSDGEENQLQTETLVPRTDLPPLLQKLSERQPEDLHYLGTSFGLTLPLYIRQTANETTGEHSCVMVRALNVEQVLPDWLEKFSVDFHKRFLSLSSFSFRTFSTTLALEVENACRKPTGQEALNKGELNYFLTVYDQKRLESYSHNLVDYHVIMDLLPAVGSLYFCGRLDSSLSPVQAAIILGLSLQRKSVGELMVEFKLQSNQVLAMFNKAIRKFTAFFNKLEEQAISDTIPSAPTATSSLPDGPLAQSLDEELEEEAKQVTKELDSTQKKILESLTDGSLGQYAIGANEKQWRDSLKGGKMVSNVSIKSSKRKADVNEEEPSN